jgi:hypothetical protein
MNKRLRLIALIVFALTVYQQTAHAQSSEEKSKATRFEAGAQFSSLTFDAGNTAPGLGGRFTFNFNDNFALDAELNYFPNDNGINAAIGENGRETEGLIGLKAGKRFKNFGIFGKARPGFISFTRGTTDIVITGPPAAGSTFPLIDFRPRRLTHFAMDVGGVLEFYPSRRIVTRFDAGVTIIRRGQTTFQSITMDATGAFVPTTVTIQGNTSPNFQFSAGIGYRF